MSTFSTIINADREMEIMGVDGRYMGSTARQDESEGCFSHQRWVARRPFTEYHPKGWLQVEIRFDDQCRNGHNTFSITAEAGHPCARDVDAGGCLHDDIAEVFPELAGLIKWHLVSSDGPMHYFANTVYHVGKGNLDYARETAVWPDATEEELTYPGLVDRLQDRLPALMLNFRLMIEETGLAWER